MEEKIKSWIERLDLNTQAFQSAFGALTEPELYRKASEDTWSVAENIEYLMAVNHSYIAILQNISAGRYRLGFLSKWDFLNRFFGKILLSSLASQNQKTKTFPVWEPAQLATSGDRELFLRFVQSQEAMKKEIRESLPLLQKKQIIASPANKYIHYSLADAYEIIVVHQQRHLAQAKALSALF